MPETKDPNVRLDSVTPEGSLPFFGRFLEYQNREETVLQAAPVRHASRAESRTAAQGLLASLKAFRMDDVRHIRHAENKQLQLQVAHTLGLHVPRTLTTNDPGAVVAFAEKCAGGMVTKMFSSFAVYEGGQELVIFTNPVRP